jgi:hypothetical protein
MNPWKTLGIMTDAFIEEVVTSSTIGRLRMDCKESTRAMTPALFA